MKETGIIMSGNHPKLILDGIKTMTRRVLTPQPIDVLPMNVPNEWVALIERNPNHGKVIKCRYGETGDRLWVRETFSDIIFQVSDSHSSDYIYKAEWDKPLPYNGKWKPSTDMPRWASRILLEITEVRVERVQEITKEDAKAEGSTRPPNYSLSEKYIREWFSVLWDSLNAKRGYGWEVNPWVWVISFAIV